MPTAKGLLAIGGSRSDSLQSSGEQDIFTVTLAVGYNYQFTLAAATGFTNSGNLIETLLDPNNVTVPTSSSQITAGGESSKSISITPTTAGTYTLAISATNGLGNYNLTATPQDDYGPAPGQLAVGTSTTGALESVGDTDTFTIALAAGYNYQFNLAAASGFVNAGNLSEILIGPNNVVVPTSSTQITSGAESSKSLSITPTTTGTYTLSIAATNGTGTYVLTTAPQDDYGPTPGTLAIGGTTTGGIQSLGDVDTFTVSLTAGLSYKFSLAAAAGFTNAGNLVETLYDPNNVLIPTNSAQITAGSESSKSISITPATMGAYKLSIAATNGLGSYTITTTNPPLPEYRFFDTNYGTHFFTSSVGERNTIIATRSDLTEETNGFGAVPQNDANAVAVFRFFDNNYGTHFFTASASERDTIVASRPDLGYEPGSTFYEHLTQQSGDVAVYRLFDQKTGTQFLTGDQGEYNGITTAGAATYRPDLKSEGVAFYAPVGTFK